MPGKEDSIPKDWSTIKDYTSRVQFVSIHTGAMEEQDFISFHFFGGQKEGKSSVDGHCKPSISSYLSSLHLSCNLIEDGRCRGYSAPCL